MTPPRLDKKQEESSNIDRVIAWTNAHSTLAVCILIFVFFILMTLLVMAFANVLGGFSCVESGTVYYHMV